MGEPQLPSGEPRGDSVQETQEVCQGPGGGLGSASCLPPADALEECREPRGSPRCLHPSSEETLPKRCGRSARAPASWPLPPVGPSEECRVAKS